MTSFSTLVRSFDVKPTLRALPRGYRSACWSPPASLGAAHKEAIYGALREVSTLAFGADMTPYWRDRSRDGFLDRISRFYFIHSADDRIVGWTGYHRLKLAGRACLYLDSTGVLPELQNTGIMTGLFSQFLAWEMLRSGPWGVYVSMRTENPVVYQSFYKVAGERNTHPCLTASVPPRVQEMGRQLSVWLKQSDKFEPSSLRVKGAYDNLDALYGELPTCDDENINRYFREHLRPVDAFLVLAKLSGPSTLLSIARRRLGAVLKKRHSRQGESRKKAA
ncbi:GNAT family N-acetyltransferase [Pyxidicoccus fallax]|uniref:GNAT family N-acetyltransferase n=1 Tax=Pyxidicoccus fallax TaxID=394095 RepID=A0A848LLB5_9BACT|nr:GNAT family N-acetyltransferase [Pyxidicoccus fallax]NMO18470.1 GNAT family N-acetyltransferase [Pyxidicoccus fallax]NPC81681.1 GNAT family N-acetyltransferase [Pyxidicoccus fallax]